MTLLTITTPLFLLILAGYIGGWRNWVSIGAVKGLSGFAFYFALPILLFRLMSAAPLAAEFDGRFVATYTAAGLCMYIIAAVTARRIFNSALAGQSLFALSASFGNLAIIALPITVELFGPKAVLPATLLITLEAIVYMPLTIILIEISRAENSSGLSRAVGKAFRPLMTNPIILALIVGGFASVIEFKPPVLIGAFMELVADAAIPVSLFALGATLSQRPWTEHLGETTARLILKLACYPAVMFGAMSLLPEVDPIWRATAILAAAMPMGANVYLVAEAYDQDVGRASAGVLLSTAISVVTVTIVAALVSEIVP